MKRLNITIPDEVAEELKDKPNKSRYIAQAVKEKLSREKQKRLEEAMAEGYRAAAKEDSEVQSDWQEAELDKWK